LEPQESFPLRVAIQREPQDRDLPLPAYATKGSVGLDLYAAVPADAPVTVPPGERVLISTGIRLALPPQYEAQVRPRSGLAIRYGVTLLNSPGTIDSDYRGVVQVILINLGSEPFVIQRGVRIAQMVIAPVTQAVLVENEALEETERGDGGFGSTGLYP
jgi:dUTP pyrophosphatase